MQHEDKQCEGKFLYKHKKNALHKVFFFLMREQMVFINKCTNIPIFTSINLHVEMALFHRLHI